MRKTFIVAVPMLAITLASCGNSAPAFINGNWSGSLANPDGSSAFAFSAQLTQKSGSSVAVSNFSFNQAQTCFSGQPNSTATFASTGKVNGIQTGNFTMMISPTPPTGTGIIQSTLTLQGTVQSDGTISGTWGLGGRGWVQRQWELHLTPHPPA